MRAISGHLQSKCSPVVLVSALVPSLSLSHLVLALQIWQIAAELKLRQQTAQSHFLVTPDVPEDVLADQGSPQRPRTSSDTRNRGIRNGRAEGGGVLTTAAAAVNRGSLSFHCSVLGSINVPLPQTSLEDEPMT